MADSITGTEASSSQIQIQAQQQQQIHAYRAHINKQKEGFPESQLYLGILDQYIRKTVVSDRSIFQVFEYANSERNPWQPVHHTTHQKNSRIVVSTGFPSPMTIVHLGSTYSIPAEVFLGHLEMERVLSRDRTSFELPTLPSQRHNFVHVSLMTLGRTVENLISEESITSIQNKLDKIAHQDERALFDRSQYCATRFRRTGIHNRRYFSVEQRVTFLVSSSTSGHWTGIFLLDDDGSIRPDFDLPWTRFTSKDHGDLSFLPVPNYNENIDTVSAMAEVDNMGFISTRGVSTYHPLKDMLSELDLSLSPENPFILLYRLLHRALLSYVQISNFLDEDTLRCQRALVKNSHEIIELLRLRIDFIDSIVIHLQSYPETIEQWSMMKWPELQSDSFNARMIEIKISLLKDVEYLLNRYDSISRRCERTVSLLLSSTSVAEAQKSMTQATNVSRLTQLAFYFLPVTLAASIFGMNVQEINSSRIRIWVFVVLAACLTFAAVTFSRLERIKSLVRSMITRFQHE